MRVKIANWAIGGALAAFAYFLIFGTFEHIGIHAFIALYTLYATFIFAWPVILAILFGMWAAHIAHHVIAAAIKDSGR